jgi:hypothetical protein
VHAGDADDPICVAAAIDLSQSLAELDALDRLTQAHLRVIVDEGDPALAPIRCR